MVSLTRLIATLVFAAALPLPAAAQAYPNKVIKMVLPFPAGSATDGAARIVAAELQKSLGQPVIIENMAGADGIIAAQAAKRAAPDGYTLFVSTNSAHGVNSTLYKELPYDPEKDFDPVAGLIRIPLMLLVKKDFPADDVAGFVKVARERGKPMSFGTGNTSSRVAPELLKTAAKLDVFDVPYKGAPQALQDLAGGQVDFVITDPFSAAGLLNGGQLKALAVTDKTRVPLFPNVPTMAEAGYKEVEIVTWAAVFAPAKTDPAIVDRLNREINRVLALQQVKEYIYKMGATPFVTTPAEMRGFVTAEIARWGRLVQMAGIPKK